MKTEIIQELEDNVGKMVDLIAKQKFSVEDAQKFLKRYFNIYRSMENLSKSRDNWKNKYLKLKGV